MSSKASDTSMEETRAVPHHTCRCRTPSRVVGNPVRAAADHWRARVCKRSEPGSLRSGALRRAASPRCPRSFSQSSSSQVRQSSSSQSDVIRVSRHGPSSKPVASAFCLTNVGQRKFLATEAIPRLAPAVGWEIRTARSDGHLPSREYGPATAVRCTCLGRESCCSQKSGARPGVDATVIFRR